VVGVPIDDFLGEKLMHVSSETSTIQIVVQIVEKKKRGKKRATQTPTK